MTLEFLIHVAIAGFLATYCHLVAALWLDSIGLPRLDLSRAMANFTYGKSFDKDPPYWAGQFLVCINGIVFALIYASLVAQYLPGPPLVRGVLFGLGLFVMSGFLFEPFFVRVGLFLTKIDGRAWITALIVHVVWGLIVGWLSPILVN